MGSRRSLAMLCVLMATASADCAPVPPACTGPEFHQFDFWLGDWEVVGGPEGVQPLGRSKIARVSGGCALSEHWTNQGGQDGRSLNAYDSVAKEWTQFWVGFDGVILRLHGGFDGTAMVMHGELPAAGGGVQQQRISWTPTADGSVIQKWETSDDDSKTWAVSFLGVYRRAEAAGP